jgi:hypothetical protein
MILTGPRMRMFMVCVVAALFFHTASGIVGGKEEVPGPGGGFGKEEFAVADLNKDGSVDVKEFAANGYEQAIPPSARCIH